MSSSKAASDCDRISVKLLTGSHSLSSMGRPCGPLRGGADFTGAVFFSMMACFLWSLGGCALVWIRAGFSRGCASLQKCGSWSVWSLLTQGFPWLRETSSQGRTRSASYATHCAKASIRDAN